MFEKEYQFTSEFNREPDAIARSSGRVNLIGEHTDYNGGFVLPTPIPQATQVEIALRKDSTVVAVSSTVSRDESRFEYTLGKEEKKHSWGDYLQGVTWVLAREGFKISGFDVLVRSQVPMGSGLSSSAALETSLLKALRSVFNLEITDVNLALLGQKVENDFVGAHVGIMDQMACSLANPGEALFLDTRNLEYRRITIPKELDLIVINSGIVHKNVGNEYNLRRSQCESVCQKLNLEFLRELGLDDLSKLNGLDEILIKRARHVVTENDRVLKAVSALENSDFMQLGKLFNESHESMKNDYEVSTAGIDHLVKIAQKTNGVFGARMTGGGFGGSIVAISKKGTGSTLAKLIAMEFASSSDYKPTVLVS